VPSFSLVDSPQLPPATAAAAPPVGASVEEIPDEPAAGPSTATFRIPSTSNGHDAPSKRSVDVASAHAPPAAPVALALASHASPTAALTGRERKQYLNEHHVPYPMTNADLEVLYKVCRTSANLAPAIPPLTAHWPGRHPARSSFSKWTTSPAETCTSARVARTPKTAATTGMMVVRAWSPLLLAVLARLLTAVACPRCFLAAELTPAQAGVLRFVWGEPAEEVRFRLIRETQIRLTSCGVLLCRLLCRTQKQTAGLHRYRQPPAHRIAPQSRRPRLDQLLLTTAMQPRRLARRPTRGSTSPPTIRLLAYGNLFPPTMSRPSCSWCVPHPLSSLCLTG
jgi:hypothetical protein